MEQQPTASTVLVWYLLIDRHGEAIAESSIDGVLVSDGATVLEFRRRVLAINAAILGCNNVNVVASHLSVFKSARDFVRGEAVALTANVNGLQSCVEKPLLVAVRANLTKHSVLVLLQEECSLQFDQEPPRTIDIRPPTLNALSLKHRVSDAAVPALEPTVEHEVLTTNILSAGSDITRTDIETHKSDSKGEISAKQSSESPNDVLLSAFKLLLTAFESHRTQNHSKDSYIANQDDVQRKIQDGNESEWRISGKSVSIEEHKSNNIAENPPPLSTSSRVPKTRNSARRNISRATYPRVYEATPAYIDQNGFLHQVPLLPNTSSYPLIPYTQPGFLPSSDQSDQPVYLPVVGPIPNEPPAEWVIPVSKPITIRNPDDQNGSVVSQHDLKATAWNIPVLKPVKIQNPKTSAVVTISANGDVVESVNHALNPDASDFVVEHDDVEPEVEQLIPSVADSVDSVVSIEAPDSCESITCNSDFRRLDDNDSIPTSPTGMPIPGSVFNPNIYKSQPWWSIETSSDEEDTPSQVISKIN
ncbi:hypothetical protein HDU79_006916 [Rhizoclosmatium sp. JEL0117]|nr:hypothetical protein HDU79_006916 [Rhizoclosmatium sp. JEL0117]